MVGVGACCTYYRADPEHPRHLCSVRVLSGHVGLLNPRRLGLYARGCTLWPFMTNSRDSAVLHGTQSRTVGNDRRFVSEKIRVLRMPTPLATNLLIALGSAILLRALGFISMPILALTLPVALWTATIEDHILSEG